MVVMRVAPRSLSEVVNAVQSSVSSIAAHGGYCMGFAEPAYVSFKHVYSFFETNIFLKTALWNQSVEIDWCSCVGNGKKGLV